MCWNLCCPLYVEFFPYKRNPCSASSRSAAASGILFLRCESVLSKGSCERLHVSEVQTNSNSSNSEGELSVASIRVFPRAHSSPAALCSRLRPPVTALLVPSSLPEGKRFGSLGTYPGQPTSSRLRFLGAKWSSSDSAGSQEESSGCVFALSESLLSPRFVPWLFLCPFSEQGWTPGNHRCSRSWQNP